MAIDERHYVDLRGKRFVLYEGLLGAAHAAGLKSIGEEVLQVPHPGNGEVAVVRATVEFGDGRRFQGIGDASESNVGRAIAPHRLRMASTRAKARALRDALNIAAAALEETGGEEEPKPAAGNVGAPAGSGGTVTDKQARYLKYLVVETGHDLARFVEKHGEPEDLPREKGRQLIERYKGILEGGSGDG